MIFLCGWKWGIRGPTGDTCDAAWCLEDRPLECSGTLLSRQWSKDQIPIGWDGSVFTSWYSDGPSPQLPATILPPTLRKKILGIVWRKTGHLLGVGWWWIMLGPGGSHNKKKNDPQTPHKCTRGSWIVFWATGGWRGSPWLSYLTDIYGVPGPCSKATELWQLHETEQLCLVAKIKENTDSYPAQGPLLSQTEGAGRKELACVSFSELWSPTLPNI